MKRGSINLIVSARYHREEWKGLLKCLINCNPCTIFCFNKERLSQERLSLLETLQRWTQILDSKGNQFVELVELFETSSPNFSQTVCLQELFLVRKPKNEKASWQANQREEPVPEYGILWLSENPMGCRFWSDFPTPSTINDNQLLSDFCLRVWDSESKIQTSPSYGRRIRSAPDWLSGVSSRESSCQYWGDYQVDSINENADTNC